jgi:hypothetical protein
LNLWFEMKNSSSKVSFPLSSPRPSATSAVFSPSYARSTASSVMRAEQVAAELAQRERDAIIRLESDAIVAAELKKEALYQNIQEGS